MRVLKEVGHIDLLLSDVELPGSFSGPELAAEVKTLNPNLKIVFMSGYAADLYAHGKIPGFNETLLTKPFRRMDLVKTIQEALAA